MLISVTIVICTSFIVSTLFYLSKKHTLLEQEKERTKEEKIKNYLENFTLYFFILMPSLALVLTLLIFWGYEIFNWLIKL